MANNVQDLNLSVFRKKRFRLDGDDSRILELDTADLNILTRLNEKYPELRQLEEKVKQFAQMDTETDDDLMVLADYSETLKAVDLGMRACVDYIFDTDVCAKCITSGSMYDPIDGKFRYEHLIEILFGLYESNLSDEALKIRERVKSHTKKYTNK